MSVALVPCPATLLDELVNVYSKAPQSEREQVYEILEKLYPTENDRLNKIKNPEETR